MNINILSDDILYLILSFLSNINLKFTQKKWLELKISHNHFEYLLKKYLYKSPFNKTLLILPKKKKLVTLLHEGNTIFYKNQEKIYLDKLKNLKKIRLYDRKFKLLFWNCKNYNSNVNLQIRLIYTRKLKYI